MRDFKLIISDLCTEGCKHRIQAITQLYKTTMEAYNMTINIEEAEYLNHQILASNSVKLDKRMDKIRLHFVYLDRF